MPNKIFKRVPLLCSLIFFLANCGLRKIPMQKQELEVKWLEVQNQYQKRVDLLQELMDRGKQRSVPKKKNLKKLIEAKKSLK